MFGNRLRELRLAKKLKQEDVSRHIGIARTTYAMYEQNNRQPDNETLIKLAVFFGVTVDHLIGKDLVEGTLRGDVFKERSRLYMPFVYPPKPEDMSEEEYARRKVIADEIFRLPAGKMNYIEAILEAIRKETK